MEKPPRQVEHDEKLRTDKLIQRIKEVKSILLTLPFDKTIEMHDEIAIFGIDLQNKYPNTISHILYHELISSTIPSGTTGLIYDDFSGEDSIMAFVDRLEKKYSK
jgi:hypothetical protein